jgi:uncharacterized protein (TIGR02594 family)
VLVSDDVINGVENNLFFAPFSEGVKMETLLETEMQKPRWVDVAESLIGQKEVAGKESNPLIQRMCEELGYKWLWAMYQDDSLFAWCGLYCGYCFRKAGIRPPPECYRASEWLKWGTYLSYPLLGCVGVKKRKGGNHVFIVIGISTDKKSVVVVGGNQTDAVTITTFLIADVEKAGGWRWPNDGGVGQKLPVMNTNVLLKSGKLS